LVHAEANELPGPVNIGSGRGTKIMELADRVLHVTKAQVKVVRTPAREIEVAKFVADVGLMRSLGLEPESDPLQHLAELVDAYRP
jgi:UDP-glucose 4-epimerase